MGFLNVYPLREGRGEKAVVEKSHQNPEQAQCWPNSARTQGIRHQYQRQGEKGSLEKFTNIC